jgi:hypothetical protein
MLDWDLKPLGHFAKTYETRFTVILANGHDGKKLRMVMRPKKPSTMTDVLALRLVAFILYSYNRRLTLFLHLKVHVLKD